MLSFRQTWSTPWGPGRAVTPAFTAGNTVALYSGAKVHLRDKLRPLLLSLSTLSLSVSLYFLSFYLSLFLSSLSPLSLPLIKLPCQGKKIDASTYTTGS